MGGLTTIATEGRALRYLRRLFSIPAVLALAPLMILTAPVVLPILALIDLLTGARRLPLVRLGIMAIIFALHEWYAALLYLRFGLFPGTAKIPRLQQAMGDWSGSLLDWCGRVLGARVDWGDLDTMPPGQLLVLARHASNIDAIIPCVLFTKLLQRPAHYVLKRELRWFPSFDLFAPPLGNSFVERGRNTEDQLAQLDGLARAARPDGALVIFPEGTFATPAKRARIRASLERKGEHAAVALTDELMSLLPPKPAGVLALRRARPDAAPLVLAHRGLDGVSSWTGFRSKLPLTDPIVVRWWPTAPPPDSAVDQRDWLADEWRRLDRWIVSGQIDPPGPDSELGRSAG